MTTRAVIAGVTGLIASSPAEPLVARSWAVHGVARPPQSGISGVRPFAGAMLGPEALRSALAGVDPTHVCLTTGARRVTEEENIAAHSARVPNLLSTL